MSTVKQIRRARLSDLESLAKLFDTYRIFCGRDSDISLAKKFLTDRFTKQESVIFVAESDDGALIGFNQLYPKFSSVFAKRVWILNDLYVSNDYRKLGIAKNLIQQALEFCRETKSGWVEIQTPKHNQASQALYKRMGFVKENYFDEFVFQL